MNPENTKGDTPSEVNKSGWSAGNAYTGLLARQLALFLDCDPLDLVGKFAQLEDYLNVANCWIPEDQEKVLVKRLQEIEALVFPKENNSKQEAERNRVKGSNLINATLRILNRHYMKAGLLTPQKETGDFSIFG